MKTCLSCVHCYFNRGSSGDYPGEGHSMQMECKKGHWDLYENEGGIFDNHIKAPRECLLMAETCADYQRDPKLPPPQEGKADWA